MAWYLAHGCGLAYENCIVRRVRQYERCCPEDVSFADSNVIPDGGIYANKRALADGDATRDHSMGRNEAMIFDLCVMPNMIARPHNDITPHAHKGLDDVILHDDGVGLCDEVGPYSCPGAHMAGQGVALRFSFRYLFLSSFVDSLEADCHEHFVGVGRVAFLHGFKRDDRQAEQLLGGTELLVHRERDNVPTTLLREVIMDNFGDLADAENNYVTHVECSKIDSPRPSLALDAGGGGDSLAEKCGRKTG